jgi:2-dehydro-3-deoxyphosphogluconate aldolase/(4S)-4-hydroxy-2-oxoglutarate aldolase
MDTNPVAGRVTGAAMTSESAAQPRTAVDDVIDAIGEVRIVPVLTIDDAPDAPGLASALVDGGLPVVEITLRTPAAIEAIRLVTTEVSAAVVGAGTVTSATAAAAAIDAGARFIVSPGLDEGVIMSARDRGVPVIPGIATATELMRAVNLGVDVVKLFPAEVVGGAGMITALSAVWPDVRFMPTGGVSSANARGYLALRQVLAVGGSWMVRRSAVVSRDWASVTGSAAAALELTQELA